MSSISLNLETQSSDSLKFEIEVFRHPDQGISESFGPTRFGVISDSKVIPLVISGGHFENGHFSRSLWTVILIGYFGH